MVISGTFWDSSSGHGTRTGSESVGSRRKPRRVIDRLNCLVLGGNAGRAGQANSQEFQSLTVTNFRESTSRLIEVFQRKIKATSWLIKWKVLEDHLGESMLHILSTLGSFGALD